jgi:hypothetical protein
VSPRAGRCLWCAAAATAVLISGCGGSKVTQRQAVATYIKRVQRVENAMQPPLSQVGHAGSALAGATGQGSQDKQAKRKRQSLASARGSLRSAERRLAALRGRLAAIRVPRPARHLRTLMLRLADRQLALTREVAQLERFLPAFESALKPLGPASVALHEALAVQGRFTRAQLAAVDRRKADALERFRAAVRSVAAAVGKLRPPAVSLPAYRTQMDSLEGMSAAAAGLATALRTAGSGGTAALVQFDRAATVSQTIAAQKAQIAAIKAYDAEVAGLRRLAVKVYSERARLDTRVPNV